jgi:deoxyribose-phosphate aldolase
MNISPYISHEILKQDTLLSEVENICKEAIQYNFHSVCVLPLFIKKASQYLDKSNVKIATVVGFPFGSSAIEAKVAEIVLAILDGADEIEMVVNIAAIKNNDWNYIANEINTILPIIKNKNKVIKVIIESGLLTDEELIKCCDIYGVAGVDFVKTSTGFAAKNTSIRSVSLIRTHLSDAVNIEASGGIQSYSFAKELLNAGANRIGSASAYSVVIAEESHLLKNA